MRKCILSFIYYDELRKCISVSLSLSLSLYVFLVDICESPIIVRTCYNMKTKVADKNHFIQILKILHNKIYKWLRIYFVQNGTSEQNGNT